MVYYVVIPYYLDFCFNIPDHHDIINQNMIIITIITIKIIQISCTSLTSGEMPQPPGFWALRIDSFGLRLAA